MSKSKPEGVLKCVSLRLDLEADRKLRMCDDYHKGDLRSRLMSAMRVAETCDVGLPKHGRIYETAVRIPMAEAKEMAALARRRGVSTMTLINACLRAF